MTRFRTSFDVTCPRDSTRRDATSATYPPRHYDNQRARRHGWTLVMDTFERYRANFREVFEANFTALERDVKDENAASQ